MLAERRGFGSWVIADSCEEDVEDKREAGYPLIASAPFYMKYPEEEEENFEKKDSTNGKQSVKQYPRIFAHLTKSNAIVKKIQKAPEGFIRCTLVVSGPDGYVSPDWYDLDDQVPTWNYVSIHIRGRLRLLPQEMLPGVLNSLSQKFENELARDKRPWSIDKLPSKKLKVMMAAICPVVLDIEKVNSTWKLGQNKPESSRKRVGDSMINCNNERISLGVELGCLGRLHNTPFNGDEARFLACSSIKHSERPWPLLVQYAAIFGLISITISYILILVNQHNNIKQ